VTVFDQQVPRQGSAQRVTWVGGKAAINRLSDPCISMLPRLQKSHRIPAVLRPEMIIFLIT